MMLRRAVQKSSALLWPLHRSGASRDTEAATSSASAGINAAVQQGVEYALATIRSEYTALPRFNYHLPLDYEATTLPPRFEPPVWVPGEELPLPPPSERHGTVEDAQAYLEWGKYDHDRVMEHVLRELPSLQGCRVMDFGCSSGRALRHFTTEIREHGWKMIGVDVSARRIEWLRRHFPRHFEVYVGTTLPTLPFESNSFDVIYGFSVFTHIKFLWDMWLLELRRVLKPGGILIQTFHSEHAWRFFYQHRNEEWVSDALAGMRFDSEEMPEDFVYYGDIDRSQIFWKRDVAVEFWGRYFRVVHHYPPPERYWYQDALVCRK